MKRHAPGGYEPHGPPQHQVQIHVPWRTSPMHHLVQLAGGVITANDMPACACAEFQRHR